jgi:hypothetical protein
MESWRGNVKISSFELRCAVANHTFSFIGPFSIVERGSPMEIPI